VVVSVLLPLMRRFEFPGKRRLRLRIRVPEQGVKLVVFPEGMTLKLDLSESLQRDFYAGLHDAHELRLVRRLLDGDFVDVGAHIGLYTVFAAGLHRGRVLAFEPNPAARRQLEENVRLNSCDNVIVSDAAASSQRGHARLAVPRTNDPSFSTLERAEFEGDAVDVRTTTVDDEVERHGLRPSLVKIDVQDHELDVLAGMERTLEHRPAVLCEIGEVTADTIAEHFRGWRAYRVESRRLREGVGDVRGYFNALFVPDGIR
jgi:FkbM family methyltransferase